MRNPISLHSYFQTKDPSQQMLKMIKDNLSC